MVLAERHIKLEEGSRECATLNREKQAFSHARPLGGSFKISSDAWLCISCFVVCGVCHWWPQQHIHKDIPLENQWANMAPISSYAGWLHHSEATALTAHDAVRDQGEAGAGLTTSQSEGNTYSAG